MAVRILVTLLCAAVIAVVLAFCVLTNETSAPTGDGGSASGFYSPSR